MLEVIGLESEVVIRVLSHEAVSSAPDRRTFIQPDQVKLDLSACPVTDVINQRCSTFTNLLSLLSPQSLL